MREYNEVLKRTLMWMVEHELEDPEYYGPRILEYSQRLDA